MQDAKKKTVSLKRNYNAGAQQKPKSMINDTRPRHKHNVMLVKVLEARVKTGLLFKSQLTHGSYNFIDA